MDRETHEDTTITPIGVTNWRNTHVRFGIKDIDRLRHIYAIGKTGVGKSTLLQNMAISDITRGKGICIIDPHGDIAESLLDYIPKERIADAIYFNASDPDFPIAYNPLHHSDTTQRHLIAAGLISTFKKIWFDSWGPRLEYILQFCLLTLLEYPHATLLDIQPLLTDKDFRQHVVSHVTDTHIRAFWYNEFEKYPYPLRVEAIAPILNKTGMFLTNTPLRKIIGQKETSFDMKEVLDSSKILICNLAKGVIGEDVSSLLGSMLLTSVQLAAMQRVSQKEEDRTPFYLYVDEMHSFISLSFIAILAEARKYGLSLFLTHQYIEQINEKVRSAIFGNVGTLIAFRVGNEDAKYLEKEFEPVFTANDLVNLPQYSMYLKLMIDGTTSKPFSAWTLSPSAKKGISLKDDILSISRDRDARKSQEPSKEVPINEEIEQPMHQGKLF